MQYYFCNRTTEDGEIIGQFYVRRDCVNDLNDAECHNALNQ